MAAPLALEAWALRRGDPRLRVVRAGVGPERARRTADRLARTPGAAVAVAGVAGALDRDLAAGDVVLATELVDGDDRTALAPSDGLRNALEARGMRCHQGPIAGSDHLVKGAEREALSNGGALAVDMESPWLAPAAEGRPLAVLRVILDGPDEEWLHPGTVRRGVRALRVLREAAPVLADWGACWEARSRTAAESNPIPAEEARANRARGRTPATED